MATIYQQDSESENSRQDVETAIAKAVELRALHAALMQGTSHATHLSAQDYPVFAPSYEDEPLTGYQQILLENRKYSGNWGEYALDVGINIDQTILSDYGTENASSRKGLSSDFMNASSRKGLPSELMNLEGHICPAQDRKAASGSCANNISVLKTSPGSDYSKPRRYSLGDIKSASSHKNCKHAIISNDLDGLSKNSRKSNIVVPLTDSHSSLHSQPRNKGLSLSRLFPRLKKNKNENSPIPPQPEEVSQMLKDLGMLSMETLKKELMEAQATRDAALTEVVDMKSSLGELSQKLEYLETYCEELRKALRQVVQFKNSQPAEKLTNLPKRGEQIDGSAENSMPVSKEVMVEGFLQVVFESRLSVKQFCKILVGQIQETDHTLLSNLNSLLQPYNLSLTSKHSKAVLYHLEAIINQSLYQDFENCVFQRNGTPKLLDIQQECQARFQLFVSLRNLSWNEVLRKGTKYYSDEFSKFCDQKMSGIIATLGWTRPWPEQLLQAFFVTAKCIWLLHLLAFSFSPPLGILRVDENRPFEPHYMEDIFLDKKRPQGPSRVKIMVMPGFYVSDQVIRCKVLCRYKSVV